MYLKYIILTLSVLLCFSTVKAQNLVPNPGFEDYNACPSGLSLIDYSPTYSSFPTVKKWVKSTYSTPDYLNTCATVASQVNLPQTWMGYQYARTGNGCVGFFAWMSYPHGGLDYREYIECKLDTTLAAGVDYNIEFYANLATKYPYRIVGINKLAAHFSDTMAKALITGGLSLSADIIDTSQYITDTVNWVKISGKYTARGGERWLTIGFFEDSVAVPYQVVIPTYITDGYAAYYYIDDISVSTTATIKDTTICTDLPATIYSRHSMAKHLWSTGDTSVHITVTTAGRYWVKDTGSGLVYIDTFIVKKRKTTGFDTLICESHFPDTLRAGNTIGKYLWNTGDTTATLRITAPGKYWRKTVDTPCVNFTDTFRIKISKTTGKDTIICINTFPDTLKYITIPGKYTWNTGDTTATLRITNIGTYWRKTIDSPCVNFTDTFRIRKLKTTGIDTIICINAFPYTINRSALPGKYLWSTGDTTVALSVSAAGTYWRKTTDAPCVNYTDTFKIGIKHNVGIDTSMCINAPSITLTGTSLPGLYSWNTGAVTASITVSTNGTYSRITNDNICTDLTDVFKVQFFKTKGLDTIICNPVYPLRLVASGNPLYTDKYKWSTADTTYYTNVHDTGVYWCRNIAYCVDYTDTIRVKQTPVPFIGNDSTYCFHDKIILSSDRDYNTYLWSTGDTSRSIQVSIAGTYVLSATDNCGTKTDTVKIDIYHTPLPFISDTIVCMGDSNIILKAVGENLLWYTDHNAAPSVTQPQVNTTEKGRQVIYVSQTINNCQSDLAPLNIDIILKPSFSLGNDTTICKDAQITIGIASPGVSYTWSTGDNTCCIIPSHQTNMYIATQANICGSYSDSIIVTTEPCELCLWVPSAFSPNGDGKNDYFHQVNRCPIKAYTIHIYNRFGELLFHSGNIDRCWDGTYHGVPVEVGTYFYYINYGPDIPGQEERIYRGDITVVR